MNAHDIAKEVVAVLETGRQITPFSTANRDFSLSDAYRVTAAIQAAREARRERPIGRKIGFTNRTIWAEYRVLSPAVPRILPPYCAMRPSVTKRKADKVANVPSSSISIKPTSAAKMGDEFALERRRFHLGFLLAPTRHIATLPKAQDG
jgi:hypothetical protein